MTATISPQSTEHLIQICRERSSRGVATRADWERLAEISPDRARKELVTFLKVNQQSDARNPYDKSRPRGGLAVGFVVGVLFMAVWWLICDYLLREVVTTGKQWDIVTFTQYVAASMLPLFAWLGWRYDKNRAVESDRSGTEAMKLGEATWDELLSVFDTTRKAGGTRMY